MSKELFEALKASAMEAELSKEPITIPEFEYRKQTDFDVCLKPKAALATFPYGAETAIKQLTRELRVSRVTAIADQAIWNDSEVGWEARFLIVPAWIWFRDLTATEDFWDTGYLYRLFPTKGRMGDSARWIELYDIRFRPERLIEPTPSVPALGKSKDLPFPSQAEVERFSKAILHGWPQVTEDEAHQKAILWFPDNKVSRDRFRAIFRAIRGPKKRGKPPKIEA